MLTLPEYDIGNQFFILYNEGDPFTREDYRQRICRQSDRYILGLKDLIEADGARFGLFYIPMEGQLSRQEYSHHAQIFTSRQMSDYWNRWLHDLSAREKFLWKDLLPVFQKYEAQGLYLNYDGHLTPQGHSLVANELFELLK